MSFTPSEEKDGGEAVELITQKTKERSNRTLKINVVMLDLTSEDACQQLVASHLKAFGNNIDTL